MYGTNLLVLLGLAFYLGASFVLWQLLLKEPTPSASRGGRPHPRRWPIRLTKAVITLLGGAASGAATLLVVATVVNAGKAGTLDRSEMLAVWAVGSERTVTVLGVRLADHLPAVWIGLGGFCVGLALVIVGDRARRRVVRRRGASRRFRSSRAGVLSSRGRPR